VRAVDQGIFYFVNSWPDELAPFFVFFSEATKWGWVRIALGLLVLALIIYRPTRKATLLALLAWPLANGITEALKTAIPMLRPLNELPDVAVRVGKLTSYGTASSHSANMASIAFVFTSLHRWGGAPWIFVALMTGLSRIYVGVHYPSQVLLGWIMGILCGLIVVNTWRAYGRLRTARKEG
jgi:undecaprenyl-diphosphatase